MNESRSGESGYSLMEVIVSLTAFSVFLVIMLMLTSEMRGHEKRLPLNLMSHPQTNAVLARLRRDVLDATAPFYLADDEFRGLRQTKTQLILYTLKEGGSGVGAETVVWSFDTPGEARRRAWTVGSLTSDWTARGVPQFNVRTFDIDEAISAGSGGSAPPAVRIVAKDEEGRLAIDQIYQPRTHQ